MPAKEIDYSTTIIYKIVCNDLTITDLYVGSTTNFRMRKHTHKDSYMNENKRHYNTKIYKIIRENGGWDNWSMVQIEEYPCANGNEARTRERYWYEQLNATLNCRFPIRDKKEHYIANRDRILEQKKEYRELNATRISEYHKLNHILKKDVINAQRAIPYNCECGSICRIGDKSKHFKTKKHLAFIAQKNNVET
jgi:hypothetical protein